jgi:hypothetical protein
MASSGQRFEPPNSGRSPTSVFLFNEGTVSRARRGSFSPDERPQSAGSDWKLPSPPMSRIRWPKFARQGRETDWSRQAVVRRTLAPRVKLGGAVVAGTMSAMQRKLTRYVARYHDVQKVLRWAGAEFGKHLQLGIRIYGFSRPRSGALIGVLLPSCEPHSLCTIAAPLQMGRRLEAWKYERTAR